MTSLCLEYSMEALGLSSVSPTLPHWYQRRNGVFFSFQSQALPRNSGKALSIRGLLFRFPDHGTRHVGKVVCPYTQENYIQLPRGLDAS